MPMPVENFTQDAVARFERALATAVGVGVDRVVIIGVVSAARRSGGTGATSLSVQIAADDLSSAEAVSNSLAEPASLNAALGAQGLQPGIIESVRVLDSRAQTGTSGSIVPTPIVVGSAIGGAVALAVLGVVGYFAVRSLTMQAAHKAFVQALSGAKAGDPASSHHLPWSLSKHYYPETILGRGAFGCVVRARKRGADRSVAIKFILPSKGTFDDRELRQIAREADVLEIFTAHKCEHAVHLSGAGAVLVGPSLCWFMMDHIDGDNLEDVARASPLDDVECIRMARSVLAALKLMHAEGVIHRDVKPANVVRCALEPYVNGRKGSDPRSCGTGQLHTYKLIDFGSALGVDETLAKKNMMTLKTLTLREAGMGTPPYMSPEMFKQPDLASFSSDLWSLGVTMFECVTSRLPFQAENELLWCISVAGNMDERAPSVLDALAEDRRAGFDNNLSKVIARAMEKRVERRYASADEMHDAVYGCLIAKGESFYSVFLSYRVASETPLARIMFDELNHTVTPGGHRVTVFWDAHRLVRGVPFQIFYGRTAAFPRPFLVLTLFDHQ
jgi:serine/threonine protein kinase